MKKFLGMMIFIMIGAIVCVGATSLQTHDFENFTADIPTNSDIHTYASGTLHNVDSRYLTASSLQNALATSSDVHRNYEDEENDITYDFQDIPENGTYADELGSDAEDLGTQDGLICYNMSYGSHKEYCVIKEQKNLFIFPGDHYVKITGHDLELLKEIGKTVEFK
ncbi:hypothetical protein [Methanobrevibacter sp.]|uniref:hypothetical protein n=1 Tax=Methanobrevibacter sp. TaxID=66852 RepID=UPI0026DFE7C8|nr:hypothetical protein [Methanobrevibacter sp.]MDO5859851.1 hypothetical protein [Methanobrevibacter sp.]